MTNVLTTILAVFMAVGEWIPEAVTALIPMFYVDETGLTFLGVLAVAGLAFSVVFLNYKKGTPIGDNRLKNHLKNTKPQFNWATSCEAYF